MTRIIQIDKIMNKYEEQEARLVQWLEKEFESQQNMIFHRWQYINFRLKKIHKEIEIKYYIEEIESFKKDWHKWDILFIKHKEDEPTLISLKDYIFEQIEKLIS